jgi:hypothetical protein
MPPASPPTATSVPTAGFPLLEDLAKALPIDEGDGLDSLAVKLIDVLYQ